MRVETGGQRAVRREKHLEVVARTDAALNRLRDWERGGAEELAPEGESSGRTPARAGYAGKRLRCFKRNTARKIRPRHEN